MARQMVVNRNVRLRQEHRLDGTVTGENNSWMGESRSYQQSYSSPVVVDRVMSYNGPDRSVFWSHQITSKEGEKRPPASLRRRWPEALVRSFAPGRATSRILDMPCDPGEGCPYRSNCLSG